MHVLLSWDGRLKTATYVKNAIHAQKITFKFLPCPFHKDCFRRDTTGINSSTKKQKPEV